MKLIKMGRRGGGGGLKSLIQMAGISDELCFSEVSTKSHCSQQYRSRALLGASHL